MAPTSRERLTVAATLAGLAVAVYGWSLGGGFLNWDDPTYILNNRELRQGFSGVGSILTTFHFSNYNPLHRLSYLIEWQCFGASATAFRVTNLALHLTAAYLLYALARIWTRQPLPAACAAALFLVHPVNVETVAWISERKSLMATAFAFASAICWLRADDGMRWGRPCAVLLFTLGMLSKTSIVVLPVLLAVMDLAAGRRLRDRAAWIAAFLVPAVALGLAQVSAAASAGAVRPLHGGTLVSHVATVVAVLPYYGLSLVFPFGLTPRHEFPAAGLTDPRFFAGLALLGAIAWGVRRSWRGERRFAVAVTWCLAALLVTLVVPIPIILADRYWYFAMPLLLVVFADALLRRITAPRPAQVALAVVVLTCCGLTLGYAAAWRDSTSLWTHALARCPTDATAWVSLGAARTEAGDLDGAGRAYLEALNLRPHFDEAAENLAGIELQTGQALSAERRLAAVLSRAPERTKARAMYAVAFDLQGDVTRATREFATALEAAPDDAGVLLNYVNFCRRHRRDAEARRRLEGFLQRNPGSQAARQALHGLRGAAGPVR